MEKNVYMVWIVNGETVGRKDVDSYTEAEEFTNELVSTNPACNVRVWVKESGIIYTNLPNSRELTSTVLPLSQNREDWLRLHE